MAEHIIVYREAGRFAGWPANYGIWSWGDEIVVGFTVGYLKPGTQFHARDQSKPFVTMQARSLDGGRTWQVHPTPCRTPGDRPLSADEHMTPELSMALALDSGESAPKPCPGGLDLTHPDFALMCARSGLRAGAHSWFYTSRNRCATWQGPYALPMFGQPGIAARTDYLVTDRNTCTLFLTAAKSDGEEGRVFCARTTDGSQSFAFLSWVTPEPQGYAIMPASARLADGRVLVAVRYSAGRDSALAPRYWIDLFASDDDCATWDWLARPVEVTGRGGNPPTLTLLHDGRLCITYGYRDAPYGIRATLSGDGGLTWNASRVLRDDAGNHDIGYPRIVQRADGAMVTVYYYNDHPDGERYIAATIWRP
jgi:hypothetical protein